ncbi:site-specific DNA-methyltransferase, partial [Xylella fastidiosa subsp. multiplex]|nr:site-specific DNA-methyltransferase [Xylella fastidiosa subsp. multiplex]MRT45183.1 site-specific DNA-methyltransferase [Xylella fastidiosa subsp. multiplex]MRT95382.1 site-specific DNA-methyltransferase [Xylella fastidiosa subsp. multiplex]MRU27651.1 site-specific DNA-methyltransferase [Xylella fastidiosa subsp. multiplex]MRU30087.1 site-specific DNA-methyltransferase [Xylella fastidiosa subsp. multiplex]
MDTDSSPRTCRPSTPQWRCR